MIEVRDAAGLAAHDGEVVTLVGHYRVVSTGRHQIMYELADGSTGATNRVARVELTDGTGVDLWVRPQDEQEALAGRLVHATGRLIARPARAAGPGARPDAGPSLVDVQTVVEP